MLSPNLVKLAFPGALYLAVGTNMDDILGFWLGSEPQSL